MEYPTAPPSSSQPRLSALPPFIGLTKIFRGLDSAPIYVKPGEIASVEPWNDGALISLRSSRVRPFEVEESADSVLKLIEEHAENAAQVNKL
jgi:hypothetical protein